MLSFTELREKLSLSRRDLDRLLKEGLPCQRAGRSRQFDPQAVADWLRAHNKVKSPPPAGSQPAGSVPPTETIVRTRHEVAHHFGISERTVAEWLTDPSFPGQAGNRGRRDGNFPLEAIKAWWNAKRGATLGASAQFSARDRLNEVKARKAEIELEQLLGTLIAADEVERFLSRTVATAKAVLDQMPDQVLSCLPPAVKTEARSSIRERVAQLLKSTYETLAELVEGEKEDEADQ